MEWLNYHQLLNFYLVVREGSVQGASRVLHVTPASVSTQVKQLEKALNVQLLQKQGRGVVPTEAGHEVAQQAGEIFSSGQELLRRIRGGDRERQHLIRIGIRDVLPKMLAHRLLEPAFDFPEPVRVICHEGDLGTLVGQLAARRLDVILSDAPLDPLYRVDAHSHRVEHSPLSIVGTAELAARYAAEFPKSLRDAPILLPTRDNRMRRMIDQWLEVRDIAPRLVAEFDDSAMMKIVGSRSRGVFPIPSTVLPEVQRHYQVEEIGSLNGLAETFFAITLSHRSPHPVIDAITAARAAIAAPQKTITAGQVDTPERHD